MRAGIALAVALSLGLLTSVAMARTWYILPDGSGDAPTIQAGIDSAASGDTVLAEDGTYTGDGNRDLDFCGKRNLVVRSRNGARACTLAVNGTAENPRRGVHFHSGEDLTSVFQGFTIMNGWLPSGAPHPDESGGGILCENNSGPTIAGNTIVACVATWGGGVYLWHSSAIVDSNTFIVNAARGAGGGIRAENCSARVVRNVFEGNTASSGGAITCEGWVGTSVIRENVFARNEAGYHGGAIECSYCDAEIYGNMFVENAANRGTVASVQGARPWISKNTVVGGVAYSGRGAGIYCDSLSEAADVENTIIAFSAMGDAVFCEAGSSLMLRCCDVYGNEGGDWVGCIADQYGINGNFSAEPFFCDPESDDFTLDAASPCLNAPGCGLLGAYGQGCDVVTGVASREGQVERRFFLSENVPNPFNPTTTISYSIPVAGPVTLTVHDLTGRLVATLADSIYQPGEFTAVWDGRDDAGAPVPSGLYFARLHAGEYGAVRKMVLIK